MAIDPISLAISALGGLGGGGGTKVTTSNKSNVATQLSIGIANQIGAGSPTASGGAQSAPATQTSSNDGAYPVPVFGANVSSNPSGDLQSLLTGSSGLSGVTGNKTLLVVAGVAVAAVAVFLGMKGGK